MPNEIYRTNNMIEVVKKTELPNMFLHDRYFPTSAKDIFKSKKVYIERLDDGHRCAPFVVPLENAPAVTMDRSSYDGEELYPAFIHAAREMSLATLEKKGIGETMFDEVTPEQREQRYLADDMAYLTAAAMRSWEWMCGQILNNGCVECYCSVGDSIDDKNSLVKVRFQFYNEAFDNEVVYSKKWDDAGAGIYSQIAETAAGIDASYDSLDLILGGALVHHFVNDEMILKLLDTRNMNIGRIDPTVTQYRRIGNLGTINFDGIMLNIFTDSRTVTDPNGKKGHYLDQKSFVIAPPNLGATKFGSITQMEEEDREYHSYANNLVPRRITNVSSSERNLEMSSAPLVHPYDWTAWRTCKALA